MDSETQQSEKSTKQPDERVDAGLPPADLRIVARSTRGAVEYHQGYADGMRETMMLLVTAMLVSVFLLIRYMKEA